MAPTVCRALERIFAKASDDERLQQWDAIPLDVSRELRLMPWWKVKPLGAHKPRIFCTSPHHGMFLKQMLICRVHRLLCGAAAVTPGWNTFLLADAHQHQLELCSCPLLTAEHAGASEATSVQAGAAPLKPACHIVLAAAAAGADPGCA